MKTAHTGTKLLFQFFFIGLVVIATIAANITIERFKRDIADRNSQIQKDITMIRRKITNFNAHKDTLESTIVLWEEIEQIEQIYFGMDIDAAHNILRTLKQQYNFNFLRSSVSKPKIIEQEKIANKNILILQSLITLHVKSTTDALLYAFIWDLMDNLDGYIGINSLSVTRITKFNNAIVQRIERRGELPNLIDAHVVLEWWNIKSMDKKKL